MKSENDLVTVIVTLYNKEKYIEHCLRSIANQSYHKLEIIVVNDGSTDNSLLVAKKIENEDKRFKIIDKGNGGLSSARNYGIKLAHGQRIIFIDGDDYIDKEYISNLMKYGMYDLVISGFYESLNGKKIKECKPKNRLLNKEHFKDYVFNSRHYFYCVLAWNKLFKTDIIKKYNLQFENIVMGEDADFFFKYLAYCKNIKIIAEADYCNVIVPNTLSRRRVSNLWQHNLKVVNSARKNLSITKKDYTFLVMRSIKVTLGANCKKYADFKLALKEIKKSPEYKKINIVNIFEKQNELIYIGIKLNLVKVLQEMFKIRTKEHS